MTTSQQDRTVPALSIQEGPSLQTPRDPILVWKAPDRPGDASTGKGLVPSSAQAEAGVSAHPHLGIRPRAGSGCPSPEGLGGGHCS